GTSSSSGGYQPWLALFSAQTGVRRRCGIGKLSERCPPRIDGVLRRAGRFSQQLACGWIKAWAIRPTDRLKRKRKYNRISDQSFKIHVVVLKHEVRGFISRVLEKLLELDFDRLGDVSQAPAAHAVVGRAHGAAHEHSLVHRFEAHVEVELAILLDGHDALAPL